MFSSKQTHRLMDVESALVSFMHRVNEAYIASQTINDLVTDSDYQKLVIKHGKAAGTLLGNRYLLPGYWFSVFVAPYEAFKRVKEAMVNERENKVSATSIFLDGETDCTKEKVLKAKQQFKGLIGIKNLEKYINRFELELEEIFESVNNNNSLYKKDNFKSIVTSISTASYEFSESDDLMCSFYENDVLCGYKFEAHVTVAEFNQFSIDFSKRLVELIRPLSETNRKVGELVSKLLIGDILLK